MAVYKIVIDMDVETDDVEAVVADLQEWYSPDGGLQTATGVDYTVVVAQVENDGVVEQ